MGTLIDSIPTQEIAKQGAAFFKEHKGKVADVIKATNMTSKQMHNPDELKELFGIPGSNDIGSIKVDLSAFKKKLGLTITVIDYAKLETGIQKQIKWFAAVDRYNPETEIKKRKDKAYKLYVDYSKVAFKEGKDSKNAIKKGEAALKEISPFIAELNELAGYYSACNAVYPKHQKVFAAYDKTFTAAEDMIMAVCTKIPFHPTYQAEAMAHRNACHKLKVACGDAEKLCGRIAKNSKPREALVKGNRSIFESAVKHIAESVAPAKVKAAEKAINEAIKPATGLLKKFFGG
ncbi:MAG: hypothetical protein BM558_06015 [Roseobacter sp. MedPE-SW]|mgnify:CR=1 FL=1|nr:MAG: hypothetical protein BM558_06015 [Roseobacter sp. MedPE-SW]